MGLNKDLIISDVATVATFEAPQLLHCGLADHFTIFFSYSLCSLLVFLFFFPHLGVAVRLPGNHHAQLQSITSAPRRLSSQVSSLLCAVLCFVCQHFLSSFLTLHLSAPFTIIYLKLPMKSSTLSVPISRVLRQETCIDVLLLLNMSFFFGLDLFSQQDLLSMYNSNWHSAL